MRRSHIPDMANTIDSLPVRTNSVEGIPMLRLVFFIPLIHRRPQETNNYIRNPEHAGISRLHAIISKAKTSDTIRNVILHLVDMRKAGFTMHGFEGQTQVCIKSIVEFFMFKFRCTHMGSISGIARCILTVLDDINLPRDNRTSYTGATFFNVYVFNST